MRDYEMVVLLHPDLEIDLDKPLKKVADIIADNGGKVVKSDNWGKRKLAYPIKKEVFAVYVYYEIQLPPEAHAKVESTLNITNEVLRYLITHPVPEVEEKEDKEKKEDKEEKVEKEDVEEKDEKEMKSEPEEQKDGTNEGEDKNDDEE